MPLKIAMIGAGSVGFTQTLLRDLLVVPELCDTHFAMTDISEANLEMISTLARRDIAANRLPATVTATTDRRAAVADADYVICTVRVGGLPAFELDIDVPLRYGVDQCVGDTLCAGGIMYGQRTIAAMLDFCRDIREVAKPNALLLNYANPMAMNTWAATQYGGVSTVGLCHGVQGAHWQITRLTERWAKQQGLLAEDARLHRSDVEVVAAGLNHQTWFIKVNWRGHDMVPLLPGLFEADPEFARTEKVRIDVLKRFGYYSTESNGHLSEYLPWYRKRTAEINDWIDLSSWINGETGGYLRVTAENRNWFATDYPRWLAEKPRHFDPAKRSEEHGSYIIEAVETGRTYRGHFNVVNQGQISNLPLGCVIEIPGYVDRTGINMPHVGDLPLGCAAILSATVSVQRLAVEAAVHGDVTLLKQAMLLDPLVGAVCNPEEVWQMTDEMLVAQAQWLPQYTDEVPAAAARLAEHEARGTRVRLVETRGAARLQERSVAEMASDAAATRAAAASPDKAGLTKHDD